MANLSEILGDPWSPPVVPTVASPEDQLKDAMLSVGIKPPSHIQLDGKLHRFNSGTKGEGGHDKPGWYVAFADGVPAGRFGCWRSGVELTWRAEIGRSLTVAEEMAQSRRWAEAKAQRDAEQKKSREVAANTVELIWSQGGAASPEHPYLKRKGIQPHGARITGDGRLMVPLYSEDGELSTLQYIDENGGKLYHSGGATGSKYNLLGVLDEAKTLYLAEGFATAATITEVTGQPCVVAYSASNLVPVAGIFKTSHPTMDICIVADHDASGVGQRYAEQASAKYGVRMTMPPILGDANDYVQAGHNLFTLLVQPTGSAVIDKLQVVFGDQLGSDYEAPDELVEGLMTIGSSVVVYGDSNSGKTFWALSVATAIATGTACYGRKTDPGLVVYLASEAPASIRSRMQAIKKFYGCSLENLAMVPVPMNFYNGDQDASDVIELVKAIEVSKGKPVRLIIGDTLARMSAGANENSGEDMGPVMARFDQVATATKAALMIIHHNGKDAAKGARGWSGIRAHIDTEIEVMEKNGVRSVNVTKQRELPGKGDTIYFKLEVVEMGTTKFNKSATTCVAVPDEEAAKDDPHKANSKPKNRFNDFKNAWFDQREHAEIRNGFPYLSRSALIEFGNKNNLAGFKDGKWRNADRFIDPLIEAKLIRLDAQGYGWLVIDPAAVATMQK